MAIGFFGEGNELVDLCKGLMLELAVFFFVWGPKQCVSSENFEDLGVVRLGEGRFRWGFRILRV